MGFDMTNDDPIYFESGIGWINRHNAQFIHSKIKNNDNFNVAKHICEQHIKKLKTERNRRKRNRK